MMQNQHAISLPIKLGIVGGGYGMALLVGLLVAQTGIWMTAGNSHSSGGMAAFGDAILFLGVFGAAAIIPTCAVYYFLRPLRSFWTVYGGGVLLLAASALAALVVFFLARTNSGPSVWLILAVLRLVAAPPFAILMFLGGIFSPVASSRWMLFVGGALESIAFAGFLPLLFYIR
jgi:hypothetical protein